MVQDKKICVDFSDVENTINQMIVDSNKKKVEELKSEIKAKVQSTIDKVDKDNADKTTRSKKVLTLIDILYDEYHGKIVTVDELFNKINDRLCYDRPHQLFLRLYHLAWGKRLKQNKIKVTKINPQTYKIERL